MQGMNATRAMWRFIGQQIVQHSGQMRLPIRTQDTAGRSEDAWLHEFNQNQLNEFAKVSKAQAQATKSRALSPITVLPVETRRIADGGEKDRGYGLGTARAKHSGRLEANIPSSVLEEMRKYNDDSSEEEAASGFVCQGGNCVRVVSQDIVDNRQ